VDRYVTPKTALLGGFRFEECYQDSIFLSETKKTEKQIENIRRIAQDLYERRERKIYGFCSIN